MRAQGTIASKSQFRPLLCECGGWDSANDRSTLTTDFRLECVNTGDLVIERWKENRGGFFLICLLLVPQQISSATVGPSLWLLLTFLEPTLLCSLRGPAAAWAPAEEWFFFFLLKSVQLNFFPLYPPDLELLATPCNYL